MSEPYALSRRTVLGSSAALGLSVPLLGAGNAEAAPPNHDPNARAATRRAVSFLQRATDAHRASGPRLVQSFQDASGLGDVGFIYDNALTAMALLAAGDDRRARAIGDGFLAVQESDGRLRQAYRTSLDPQVPAANFGLTGTAVGDMSWTGLALAQLARATGARRYLDGLLKISTWIQRHAYSTTGLGGYEFGLTPGLEGFKSAEHNIDVCALFRLVARLTGDRRWRARAEHAWDFVERMWNAEDGYFWTGSNDGATINKSPTQLPLDVQTWSWLAASKPRYAAALDWAATHLATTDTPLRRNSTLTGNMAYTGVAFASGSFLTDTDVKIDGQDYNPKPDDCAVWFEGTGQLALALRDRRRGDDRADAERLLDTIRVASAGWVAARPRGQVLSRGDRRCLLAHGHRLPLRLLPQPPHRSHLVVRVRVFGGQPVPVPVVPCTRDLRPCTGPSDRGTLKERHRVRRSATEVGGDSGGCPSARERPAAGQRRWCRADPCLRARRPRARTPRALGPPGGDARPHRGGGGGHRRGGAAPDPGRRSRRGVARRAVTRRQRHRRLPRHPFPVRVGALPDTHVL